MFNEIDQAFKARLEKELQAILRANGFFRDIDETMIDVTADSVTLLRYARRKLAKLESEGDRQGTDVFIDLIKGLQETTDKGVKYFGINLEKHKHLAALISK